MVLPEKESDCGENYIHVYIHVQVQTQSLLLQIHNDRDDHELIIVRCFVDQEDRWLLNLLHLF